MERLRIGQFTDSFPPVINGVSALVIEHHAELLARRQDVHVFTFGYLNHRDDPPKVHRSPGLPIGTSPFRTFPVLNRSAHRIAASLDVYHAHEALSIGQIATRYAKELGRPLIFTNHTRHDLYVLNYPRLVQPFLRRHVFFVIRQLIHASAMTTAPSRDSARWLQSLAPEHAHRIRVVNNGTRLERFDRIEPHLSRDTFGIGAGQTLFISVCRLSPEKNLSAFAEALIHAVRDGADAHWMVIGDGLSRAKLEAETAPIRSRAHFLGAIPNASIAPYLAMADLFATPSLSETNSVSVIEGMACGLPYLGLEADWWEDFSTGDSTAPAGLLASHDPRDLAVAIRRLCDDAALRARLGAQAKRLSRRFDMRTVTSRWLEIYHEAQAEWEARFSRSGAPAFR